MPDDVAHERQRIVARAGIQPVRQRNRQVGHAVCIGTLADEQAQCVVACAAVDHITWVVSRFIAIQELGIFNAAHIQVVHATAEIST